MRLLLIVLLAALAGCSTGSDNEAPPAARPLVLEHLTTILDYALAWGSEAKVAFDGSTMFVPNGGRGISIYDLGDLTQPERITVVGQEILGGQGGAMAVENKRAFVAVPDIGEIVGRIGGRIGELGTPMRIGDVGELGTVLDFVTLAFISGNPFPGILIQLGQ